MEAVSLDSHANLPCYDIPYGLNPQFFSRSAEVARIRELLNSDFEADGNELKVLAIHGAGGLGKTQLALHYANTSLDLFDAIAFISAETPIKFSEAVARFATKLGLFKDENDAEGNGVLAISKAKDWLDNSGRRFLLIFDNVGDIDTILPVWPSGGKGSVLITTRSPSVAAKRAANNLGLSSFTPEAGVSALYAFTDLHAENGSERMAATEICRLLGSLPLALAQIGQFIREHGYNYEGFLRLCENSDTEMLSKGEAPPEYNHTLKTAWESSIQSLAQDARVLQNLLAFFDSDSIAERLLTARRISLTDDRLNFLFDELRFKDVVASLLQLSLLDRSSSRKTLSLHRLVQTATFSRIPAESISFFLDFAIKVLLSSFPDGWTNADHQQSLRRQTWETSQEILPHVQRLIEMVGNHKLDVKNIEEFAELTFRAANYLLEIEQPSNAWPFLKCGLCLEIDRSGPLYNQAYHLFGNLLLDLSQPNTALTLYKKTLRKRLDYSDIDWPAIADVCESIACAYVEIGDIVMAFGFLDQANAIRIVNNWNRMDKTLAIYAIAYLRAQEPDQALEAIRRSWGLQHLTEAHITTSTCPHHGGDLVLLACIYLARGDRRTALRLAAKSISSRKEIFGSQGPRVADSMFLAAYILRELGEPALANQMLREIIDFSEGIEDMRGHLARALWTLGVSQEDDEGEGLKELAKKVRESIQGREEVDEDTDQGFSKLVRWMLW